MNYTILLIEDEIKISSFIKAYLDSENFTTLVAKDGQEALDIFYKEDLNIHLVILDLMIPKISGEEVCKTIRASSNVPLIMLTAKTMEEDKLKGLSIGADDYIVKPFSPKELVARIKVLLRRVYSSMEEDPSLLSFNNNDLKIYINKNIVKKDNIIIDITSNEFKILVAMASHYNQVLTREQIISIAFGNSYEGYDRTIDTYIKNIRHKIETDPKNPNYIETIYGTGYRFKKTTD